MLNENNIQKKKKKKIKQTDNKLELEKPLESDKTESISIMETKEPPQDLSKKFVQEVTLEYMGNGSCYKSEKNNSQTQETIYKNKKFYRKRIIQLTKDLLSLEEENKELYHPDIYKSFYKFVNTSIDYFQTVDRTDILQDEYKDLEDSISKFDDVLELDNNRDDSLSDANKHLMRQINLKNATLDGLVKRTLIKKEEPVLPKKKKINLKDPELKNKGVSKKNNLTNN